jgi:hypothetical protein
VATRFLLFNKTTTLYVPRRDSNSRPIALVSSMVSGDDATRQWRVFLLFNNVKVTLGNIIVDAEIFGFHTETLRWSLQIAPQTKWPPHQRQFSTVLKKANVGQEKNHSYSVTQVQNLTHTASTKS